MDDFQRSERKQYIGYCKLKCEKLDHNSSRFLTSRQQINYENIEQNNISNAKIELHNTGGQHHFISS
jgi:hypothetical protein